MSEVGLDEPVSAVPADVGVRPAATVMLLRDHGNGLQVFVLQRVSTMAFAPGMTVFPGGAVDPSDHEQGIAWHGPDQQWWAAALGTAPSKAYALVVAAVRELFEESGVLLAEPAGGRPAETERTGSAGSTGPTGPAVTVGSRGAAEAQRNALAAHTSGLSQVLRELDLQLRADLLRPWANWITPGRQTRRYDTFFFVAALPDGATAELTTTEADGGRWVTPADLLAEFAQGRVGLLPPTIAALTDLAEFVSVSAVLDAPRQVVAILPELIRRADGQSLVRAGGREYLLSPPRAPGLDEHRPGPR